MTTQELGFVEELLLQWQDRLEGFFPPGDLPLGQAFELLMRGDLKQAFLLLFDGVGSVFWDNIMSLKKLLVWMILLSVFSSLLCFFVDAFGKNGLSELAFYLCFLVLVGVLMEQFEKSLQVVSTGIENIELFGRLLGPAYLLSISVSGGVPAALGEKMLFLMIADVINMVILKILLPLTRGYMVLSVISCLWVEDRFQGGLDLLHKTVELAIKGILGAMTGVGFFQNLLSHSISTTEQGFVQSAISMIPGIGDASEGTIKLLTQSAGLIRNGLGIMFVILLLLLCASPIVYVFLHSAVCKVSASFMEMIGDKRMVIFVERIARAQFLLFRLLLVSMLLFVISVALSCAISKGVW